MQCGPQEQHKWLEQLVGQWAYEMECVMGPGQPATTSTGAETVRSFGGLWTIAQGSGGEGDEAWESVTTMGYDPARQRFVGSFIATMMTHLWVYSGELDAAGKVLTMDTEGPSMAGDGTTSKYQDLYEIVGPDERTLTSRVLGEDGQWQQFMSATYRRVG